MKRASSKKRVLLILFQLIPIILISQTFTEISQIFPATSQGCARFGDYDDDGDLDIVITGSGGSYIYRNNGSDSFENISAGLIGLSYSYADWGDYDNDGDLDIIITGLHSPDVLCYLYRNDGDDNFIQIDPSIEGTRNGSIEWGDYNSDGKLDILICGFSASGNITRIYMNKGNDQFEMIDINLPGIQEGNATWGDYDNDGDLDILLTGSDELSNKLSAIYKNYGNNIFIKLNSSIKNAERSEASWGDYDNDGDLDIVIGGYTSDGYEINIYRNDAAILFTSIENQLSNLSYVTADWGDYDNDSDLDILITGYINSSTYKSILVVNYGGVFVETDPGFYDCYGGSSVWGDYDNDGDLDALITGCSNTKLYRNDGTVANNLPSMPTGLNYQINDNTLILQWSESSDIETDEDGLTYNVRLGSSTGEIDEISPQSNIANGYHMIPLSGNAGTNEHFKIHLDNIAVGNHYWSVQAIDNIYAGSDFAVESIITNIPPTSSFKFALDSICFIETAVIYYTGNASPSASYTWDFDGAEYVSGSGQGPYEVKWADHGDYSVSLQVSENGLNSGVTSRNINVSSQCFVKTEISVGGSKYSTLSWADYDNDNDLDLFISGETGYHTYISKIYRNDGDNDFVDINAPLEQVGYGDNEWCDYDNDGDLDLLLTGKKYTTTWTGVTRIYRNDGYDNFVDINADIDDFSSSSVDWGDYDNDGDYDILITGRKENGPIFNSEIYRNEGDDTFTRITCNIVQAAYGDAKWGDYDNDGDLDFILTGYNPSYVKISKIYRNDGNDTFTDIRAGLVNVVAGSVDWGDYDSDGDLDLLLSGSIEPRYTTKIYRNDGNDVFTDIEATLAGVSSSSVLWGDMNNDGLLDVILTGITEDDVQITRVYINKGNDIFSDCNRELSILDQGLTISEYTITDHDIAIGDFDFDNDLDILLTCNDYDEQLFCKIFKNETQIANTAPSIPLNLNSTIQNDTIILSWTASNDGQTPDAGLTYNVRLGSATGQSDVLSPMSDITTGYHLIPIKGNAGTNKNIKFIVNGLSPGTNYWSVQAIDNNFAGSEFSQEHQISNIPPTSNFEMNESICYCDTATIYYSGNASETADYNWTFENADYISGTGQGPYLVKWDNPGEYIVSLVVIQNSVSSVTTEKPIRVGSRCFKETNIKIQGTYEGQSAWGDYDNDGDLDILVSSYYYDNGSFYATRIYRNDGDDIFTDINTDLPDVSSSIIDWGDYDNDNDLDILIIQNRDGGPSVFRNNGDDTFTDINAGLYYTKDGSAKWGDYDNDGDLDIIIVGSLRSEIYVNEGNDIFSTLDIDLVKISSGSVNWCDFDKDNDLDILITGLGAERYSLIYRNDGNGNFVNVPVNLTGIDDASTDVGDYDSDGDQDIIIAGRDNSLDYITKIYRNDGNFIFTDIDANLIGGKYSYVKWGDMDNDGDLDFIFVGDTLSSDGASIIYENKGNDSFARCNDELFGIQYYGIASWGDYDNDNDLDLMLSGLHKTKIYKNYVKEVNEKPSAPSNLNYEIKEDTLILKWSPSSDSETSQAGLSYNVRIGSSSGGYDNVTPMSDITTGFHFIPGFGNAGTDTSFMVSFEALSPGTNYWSVQTIDNSFIASEFSVEQSVPDIPPTSSFHFENVCFIDSTTITYTGTAGPSATYDWTFEDADVIIGSGQGPYTVCWNTPGIYNISLQVTEDIYTSNITNKPIEIFSHCFKSDTLTIPGMKDGSVEWGDYDDDGDLDLLLVGRTQTSTRFSRIYRNDGNQAFAEINPGLTDIYLGGAKWGDYDNDNDLDILLAGSSASGYITQIYRNDGFDLFTNINIDATGFAYCSVYWADYDNDGDLDFMVGGYTYEGRKLKIYRNIGNDEFADIGADVSNNLDYPVVKWADFDNDKDLDLSINDKYYINNGDQTFSPTDITLDLSWLEKLDYDNDGTSESFPQSLNNQILYQSEAIGDSDDDGDLDVLITGQYLTVLFKNICYHPNSSPSSPVNLGYELQGDSVILKWGRAIDDETGTDSLTYNIRIGSTPGGTENLSPMANTSTNYHLISQFGNARYDTSYYINITGLSIGTNYWSVQAIDQGLASSDFATESTMINIPPSPLFTFEDSLCYCDTILIQYSGNGSPAATYNWDLDGAIFTSGSGQGPWLVYWGDPGYHTIWLEVTENGLTSERTDSIYLDAQCFRATSASFTGASDAASEWADYDSDGDLDVVITSYSGTYLYRNDGNDLFAKLDPGLIDVMYGCIDWGDYDNDNDLDILIAGYSSSGSVRIVYRNDGSDVFTNINAGFVEGQPGSPQFGNTAYWGDYDNDGDLDILVSGTNYSGSPTGKIYRNDKNDVFTDIHAGIPQVFDGEMKWFDFDNDNKLDILAAGTDINGNRLAEIYRNNGDGRFIDNNSGFEGVKTAKVSISDFNNDGNPDILISGNAYSGKGVKLYQNNDNLSFTRIDLDLNLFYGYDMDGYDVKWINYNNSNLQGLIAVGYATSHYNYGVKSNPVLFKNYNNNLFKRIRDSFTNVNFASASLADYDNDGDLDLLISGTSGVNTTVLYKNYVYTPNVPPSVPDNLDKTVYSNNVILNWEKSTDNETPTDGLTYNVVVGSTPGNFDIVSPGSDIGNGQRSVVKNGNAGYSTTFQLKNLPVGTYYWQVQSIDNNLSGSQFSDLNAFTINEPFTEMDLGINPGDYGDIAWGDYDNDGDLDFAGTYMDEMYFMTMVKIMRNDGNGQFFDINENLSTDLVVYHDIIFNWYDINNDGRLDLIDLCDNRIFRNDGNDVFTAVEYNFTRITSYDLGDYDNDTDADILVSQQGADTCIVIYRNNGNFNFTPVDPGFLNLYNGSVSFTDYDNDLDLDVLITGEISDNNLLTQLYRNDGNANFSAINAEFKGVKNSAVQWCDYDNDSDLDVVITGLSKNDLKFSGIYRNNSNNTFTLINANIRSVINGSVDWGDYDVDGDNDLLISGESGSDITLLYRNDGNDIFTELDLSFYGNNVMNALWGNYDNDGDLDILLQGSTKTYLYRNNGNWINNPPDAPENLDSELTGFGIILKWNDATDDKTPPAGLNYNIRLGTTPGSSDIIDPMSDLETGYRKITTPGNALLNNEFRIDSLPEGTYYWSVQAIDNTKIGGAWATEESFDISVIRPFFDFETVCFGNSVHFTDQTLVAGGTITSWFWEFGDGQTSYEQNPVHLYNSPGYYTVQLTASTDESSSSVAKIIFIKPKPVADFTASSACLLANPTTFTNNSVIDTLAINEWYWDFGDGTKSYEQNPPNKLYLSAGNFNVKLIITANNGCVDSTTNTAIIGIFPTAAITSNLPLEFCDGDSTVLSVQYKPEYSYQWMLNGINITDADSSKFTAKFTGNYTVEVINNFGNCSTLSSGVDVISEPAPVPPFINVEGDTTFCQGDSIILSVTNDLSLNYQWKLNGGAVGSDSSRYSAKSSGTYSLTVTNSTGCSVDAINNVIVTVNPAPTLPTVNISGPTTFCQGENVELSVTNNPDYSYQWEYNGAAITGAVTNTYYAESSGVYTLKITNSTDCFIKTENVTVNVLTTPSAPLISADGDLEFCQGDSVVLSVTNTAGYTYQWKLNGGAVGADSSRISAKSSGTYSLTVSNSTGCAVDATNTITVTVNSTPSLPSVDKSGPTTFCLGNSVELSVTYNSAYTYQWKNDGAVISGEITNSYNALNSGVYSLRISNSDDCSVETDNVTVNVLTAPSAPLISASGDIEFCQGDSVDLSVTNTVEYFYQWKLNGGAVGTDSSRYSAKSSGTYSLAVSNSAGCAVDATNTVSVTVNPAPALPTVNLSGPASFCGGDSVILNTPSVSGNSYNWRNEYGLIPGASSTSYTAKTSGAYQLEISNSSGCMVSTSPVNVTVKPSPYTPVIESVNYQDGVCPGENLIRLSASQEVPEYNYLWYKDGLPLVYDTLSYLELSEAGNYKLEADLGGCIRESDVFNINLPEAPDKPFIYAQGPTVWYLVCSNTNADEYKWYCNGNLVAGADDYYYVAGRKMGEYQVSIGNVQDCFTRSHIVTIPTGDTGMDDVNPFEGLKIYPNPTTGLFTIEIDNNIFGELIIRVIAENGKEVMSLKQDKTTEHFLYEVDLSRQPQGLYIINLLIDKYFATRKLILE